MKKRRNKNGKKAFATIVVLAVLIGGAGAAYAFMPEAPEIAVDTDAWYRETNTFIILGKGFVHK